MESVQAEIQEEKDRLVELINVAFLDVMRDPNYENVSRAMLVIHRSYPRIGVQEKYYISKYLIDCKDRIG